MKRIEYSTGRFAPRERAPRLARPGRAVLATDAIGYPFDTNRPNPPHAAVDCWYSVKPIAEQMPATIQKRRMIFVSDHPSISKW